MIEMTIAQLAALFELHEAPAGIEFKGISIDSRTLQPGNLFVAVPGEKFDGHDFVEEARKKGAVAALVSRKVDSSLVQLQVPDSTLALGKMAAHWRDQFKLPIVAVTGSNGKTTLKNMITSIFTAACHGNDTDVLATQGNLNNHWGLPLTLARLGRHHQFAVIEMGMNHFGEIDYLTKLTRPNVAVITNAAAAHLEGVGSVEGVARAKAEIFNGLQATGAAILNRDDAFYHYWQKQAGNHPQISFGFSNDADVRATLHEAKHKQHMTLHTPKGDIDIHLPLLGKHNVANALAAAAAALAVNVDLKAIKSGLENIEPAKGRLQVHQLANGVNIIDDTYNANPFSLQAAVETLRSFEGKKILVLGDMRELGENAKSLHQTAGQTIKQSGIDYLFTYGELSSSASQAFGEGAYHFNEQEKLVNALKPFLHNTTTILVKGSRSMRMENVVAGLVQ